MRPRNLLKAFVLSVYGGFVALHVTHSATSFAIAMGISWLFLSWLTTQVE